MLKSLILERELIFLSINPYEVSIDTYLSLMQQSGTKSIRQMIYADVHWSHIEPQDN